MLLSTTAVVNLIVVMPCIWGAFAPWRWLAGIALLWIVYAVIISCLEIAVLMAILGPPGTENSIWLLMPVFNVSQCLSVLGTLVLLRGIGFRLVRLPKPPSLTSRQSEAARQMPRDPDA